MVLYSVRLFCGMVWSNIYGKATYVNGSKYVPIRLMKFAPPNSDIK